MEIIKTILMVLGGIFICLVAIFLMLLRATSKTEAHELCDGEYYFDKKV